MSVKETMNWRYCWRAGVMSRNEGGEGEGLFVWMVFFLAKASASRVTVVRDGMSVCEERMIGSTLQSYGARTAECETICSSSECCEFMQVYSSFQLSSPLRMINSLDSSFLKQNALQPS